MDYLEHADDALWELRELWEGTYAVGKMNV